jgi:hypothetical protein
MPHKVIIALPGRERKDDPGLRQRGRKVAYL